MKTMDSSNTAQNTKAKSRGKPFEGGPGKDPRINRNGRPRTMDALKKFTLAMLHEKAFTGDGKPIIIDGHHATNIEVVMRSMISSKDWRQREKALEIAYGKVPQAVEVSGADGGPVVIRWVDPNEE